MKIRDFRKVKSLLHGVATPIEITIRIDLTFVKQLADILAAELNKRGIHIESNACIKIITEMLDEYMKKRGDQDSKD